MKLSGHTVLITGGSADIGLALAQEFYQKSNQVIICSRSPEKLAVAKAEMNKIE